MNVDNTTNSGKSEGVLKMERLVKNCPFCGSTAHIAKCSKDRVLCDGCPASADYQVWQNRFVDKQIRSKNEEK